MSNDFYTLEKLNEYQQRKWDELDRQGRFIIHDEIACESQRYLKEYSNSR